MTLLEEVVGGGVETAIYSPLGERGSENPPGTRMHMDKGGRCAGGWGTAPGCREEEEAGGRLTHAVRGAGAGGPAPSGTRSHRPGSSRQAQLWLRPGPPARPRCQTSFGRVGVPGPPGAGGKGPARRRGSCSGGRGVEQGSGGYEPHWRELGRAGLTRRAPAALGPPPRAGSLRIRA